MTTELPGKAVIAGAAYEQADGVPLSVDTDYSGARRDQANPFPGHFESVGEGTFDLKVWPGK